MCDAPKPAPDAGEVHSGTRALSSVVVDARRAITRAIARAITHDIRPVMSAVVSALRWLYDPARPVCARCLARSAAASTMYVRDASTQKAVATLRTMSTCTQCGKQWQAVRESLDGHLHSVAPSVGSSGSALSGTRWRAAWRHGEH